MDSVIERKLGALGIAGEDISEEVNIKYRLLGDGDIISVDDEYHTRRGWFRISPVNKFVGKIIGKDCCEDIGIFRREIDYSTERGIRAVELLNILSVFHRKKENTIVKDKCLDAIYEWDVEYLSSVKCKVLNGFYRGRVGIIIKEYTINKDGYRYLVKVGDGAFVEFKEGEIKRI